MIVSKKLEWLEPYVVAGMALMPQGKTVTRLSTCKVNGRYGSGTLAMILSNDDKAYRIYLHTMRHPRHLKEPAPLSRIDLIKNLAHEMAHMIDWHHTPTHSQLEGRLQAIFSEMLYHDGYISEEDELK